MRQEFTSDPALWYPALSILTFMAVAAQTAISGLVYKAPYEELYENSEEHQLEKYETPVSPYYWTHYAWVAVYAWQALWVIYALVMNCRRTERGPRYADPVFIPAPLFLFTIGHCACHVVWRILMDRNEVIAGFVVIAVYTVLVYLALGVSYHAMVKACATMYSQARFRGRQDTTKLRSYDVCLVRLFLFNGLGLHAGWVTVVALLHLAKVLVYEAEVPSKTTATVFYCALLGWVLIFAATDLTVLLRVSRYTITPYVAFVYSMVAIVTRHFDGDDRNSVLAMLTLSVFGSLCVVKLVMMLYSCCRKPHHNASSPPSVRADSEPGKQQLPSVNNNSSVSREIRGIQGDHGMANTPPDAAVYQSRIILPEKGQHQPRAQSSVYHEVKDKEGRTYNILY